MTSIVTAIILGFGKSLEKRLSVSLLILISIAHPGVVTAGCVSIIRSACRITVTLTSVFLAFHQAVVIAVLLCDLVCTISISAISTVRTVLSLHRAAAYDNKAKYKGNSESNS